jgi:hypothetical protein
LPYKGRRAEVAPSRGAPGHGTDACNSVVTSHKSRSLKGCNKLAQGKRSAASITIRRFHRQHVRTQQISLPSYGSREEPGVPLSYRVEDKMRLNKENYRLKVNPSLTLAGIAPEVFNYRFGNRSVLEWVNRPVPGFN